MCKELLAKYTKKYHDHLYAIMRVMVGLLFLQHGLSKLFGLLGGSVQPAFSLMWFAGLIELLVGLGVTFGVLTRLAALGGALLMAAAYGMAHVPNGLVPLQNGGELALLFLAAFLVVLAHGGKKWYLEKLFWKKEVF